MMHILLLGPSGVRKTHLAVALGLRAIQHGSASTLSAQNLFEDVAARPAEHQRAIVACPCTSSQSLLVTAVAEHTLALMLAVMRQIPVQDREVKGGWPRGLVEQARGAPFHVYEVVPT